MELPLTLTEAAAALRDGTLTSVDLTTEMLRRTNAVNDTVGAFVMVCDETAMAAARTADEDFAAGRDKGPMQGIPLAVKDIIATHDAPTTANSLVPPAGWDGSTDAPVAARLREAGAVFIGKSTTSEYAIGMPDASKGFRVPHNPWNLDHTPAGSSSGTGIAVSAGLVLGGLGTDTGGSVRGPAAVNGHTGLKVTFGRVPKSGVVPLGYTLDSIGPMARSAADCAAMLQVMAGFDASDPYAADVAVPDYTAALTGSVEGMKIGVAMPFFFDTPDLDDSVRDACLAAVEVLKGAGAEVSVMEIPYAFMAAQANMMTLVCEAFAYHHKNLQEHWGDYGMFTRATLARGAFYSGADYTQAQRFRAVFRREVAKAMAPYDVIVTPTMPVPAERADAFDVSKRLTSATFTGQWNFAGLPACATPVGMSPTGLPVSLQIVGHPFAEATCLKVADAYQRLTDHHLQVPVVSTLVAA